MASLIATLARIALGRKPKIVCDRKTWLAGVSELRRRTGKVRESGAFLLGKKGDIRRIEEFVFYDDIDPKALDTGIILFNGRRLSQLWRHCRETGQTVIADVHVHPWGYGQSQSDSDNPIIAETGHFALILPNFAARDHLDGGFGIYEYLGNRLWKDRSTERPTLVQIGWWPKWK